MYKYESFAYCSKRKNKMTFNVNYKKNKTNWLLFGIVMTGIDEIECSWVLKNGDFISHEEENKFTKEYYQDLNKHCNEIYKKYYKL